MHQRSGVGHVTQNEVDAIVGATPTSHTVHEPRHQEETPPTVPFQHNRRVLAAAAPGVLFIFTMAGELLLGILTLGALLIYLMINGGAQRNAVITYICIFIAAQMSVLYSCLPLIWISLFNIPLLMSLNIFMVLTGAWGMLQFDFFIIDQPFLALTIEIGLFSLYPLMSTALATWTAAYLLSVRYAVYLAIIYGFLLLRIFLTPTLSSFYKLNLRQNRHHILWNTEVGAVLLVYIFCPGLLFLVSHIWPILHGDILLAVECILVALLPAFLITFIQLRGFYEQCHISLNQVWYARMILGLLALALSCWILQRNQTSAAISWLLPAVVCYTLLGITLSQRNRFWRPLTIFCVITTASFSTYAIYRIIPVSVSLSGVSTTLLTVMIVLNSVLCLLCISSAAATARCSAYLSYTLVIQAIVFTHSECYFLSRGLYSHSLAVATTLITAYTLARLRTTTKITWQCQWLASSIHAIKLPPLIQCVLKVSESDVKFGLGAHYSSAALIIVGAKILLFENSRELQSSSVVGYTVCMSVSVFVFFLNVARPVLLNFINDMGITCIVLLTVFVSSALTYKLAQCNMQQHRQISRLSGIVVVFSSLSLLLLALAVTDTISPWLLLMLALGLLLQMTFACELIKAPEAHLYALTGATFFGIPFGLMLCQFLNPAATLLTYTLYTALSVETVVSIMLLWRYSIDWKTRNLLQCTKDKFLHVTLASAVVSSVLVYVHEMISLLNSTSSWSAIFMAPSTKYICALFGMLSISIRFFCLKWRLQDPFAFKPGLLPTYGNIVTIATYLLAVENNSNQSPEIWNCASSVILLCLQQDSKILPHFTRSARSGVIAGVCFLNIFVYSFVHSHLWTRGLGFFAVLEILALPVCTPSLVIITQMLARPIKYVLPEQTVILWAPLPSVLFILGHSYTSWLLGGTSLVASLWLLQKTSFLHI